MSKDFMSYIHKKETVNIMGHFREKNVFPFPWEKNDVGIVLF